jgi:hypothetical protein
MRRKLTAYPIFLLHNLIAYQWTKPDLFVKFDLILMPFYCLMLAVC